MQTTIKCLTAGILALFLIVGLGGCAGGRKNLQPAIQQMPPQQMTVPQPALSPDKNGGSLWQARSSFNGLFIDTKARNIGDIVTVKIDESAQASNRANTETERESGFEAGIEKQFITSTSAYLKVSKNGGRMRFCPTSATNGRKSTPSVILLSRAL